MKATLAPAAALILLTGLSPIAAAQTGTRNSPAAPAVDAKTGEPTNGAQILADYKKRIDAYLKVHDEAKKDGPALKQTSDPAEIKKAQDALGSRIRELRADAKPG